MGDIPDSHFINSFIENTADNKIPVFNLFYFIVGILGIIISALWYGTLSRNLSYYKFRMAQARKAEPKDWTLLKKGEKFAKGIQVKINDEYFQIRCFANRMKNKFAFSFLFISIAMIYMLLIILFGPWWR